MVTRVVKLFFIKQGGLALEIRRPLYYSKKKNPGRWRNYKNYINNKTFR